MPVRNYQVEYESRRLKIVKDYYESLNSDSEKKAFLKGIVSLSCVTEEGERTFDIPYLHQKNLISYLCGEMEKLGMQEEKSKLVQAVKSGRYSKEFLQSMSSLEE